jgi:hypothetical protein
MMTVAILDYLLGKDTIVLLVECDTSNPDVQKAYWKEQNVHQELIDLDRPDGWMYPVSLCEEHRGRPVVINTAARNNLAVQKYGRTLGRSLEELGRDLVTLWVITRQRDSVELLREFMDVLPRAEVHVVRNGYFGAEKKFEIYNASKVRTLVEERGGKSITLPDLADRVADDIYAKRLSLTEAATTMPIGNRAELGRWRGEVQEVLSGLLTVSEPAPIPVESASQLEEEGEMLEAAVSRMRRSSARDGARGGRKDRAAQREGDVGASAGPDGGGLLVAAGQSGEGDRNE